MKTTDDILGEYAKADFENRLGLFMEHPWLRSAFLDMERRETKSSRGTRCKDSNPFKMIALIFQWFRSHF